MDFPRYMTALPADDVVAEQIMASLRRSTSETPADNGSLAQLYERLVVANEGGGEDPIDGSELDPAIVADTLARVTRELAATQAVIGALFASSRVLPNGWHLRLVDGSALGGESAVVLTRDVDEINERAGVLGAGAHVAVDQSRAPTIEAVMGAWSKDNLQWFSVASVDPPEIVSHGQIVQQSNGLHVLGGLHVEGDFEVIDDTP